MSALFVLALFGCICFLALARPALGIIGFYAFQVLDPAWNWRWSIQPGFEYQRYIFICVGIGFLLSRLQTRRQSTLAKFGVCSLILYLGMCYVSASVSVEPVATKYFMSYAWKVVLAIVFAISLIGKPSHVSLLLAATCIAQGYNALQINLDYFQNGFSTYATRPWSSMGVDNNGYSVITIPMLAISLSLAFWEEVVIKKYLFLSIALLQIHQIMLLESRGCMVAAVLMFILMIWYMPRRNSNYSLVVLAFIVAAVLAGPPVIEEFSSAFASKENRDSSAQSRFFLWKAGYRITMDHPFLGVGPDAARSLVPLAKYYDGGLDTHNKALHNLVFDVATGVGIPGALFYFSFLIIPTVYCWKTYRREKDRSNLGATRLAVVIGLPSYLMASMFSSGVLLESSYVLAIAGYCAMNIDAIAHDEDSAEPNHSRDVASHPQPAETELAKAG